MIQNRTKGLDASVIVFLIFALAWGISFVFDKFNHDPGFALDFEPYYLQAQAIRSGALPPYEVHGTKLGWNLDVTMPLTYAVLIMPLSYLSLPDAELVFCFTNIGLVVAMLLLLRKMLQLNVRSFGLLIAIMMCNYPALHGIVCGQASILLSFITLTSICFYTSGFWLISAVLLGLAGSVKVVPMLLLLVFLSRREFVYVAVCLVSFILIQGLTACLAGWDNTLFFWTDKLPGISKLVQPVLFNQSLIGYWHRILALKQMHVPWINQLIPMVLLGGASIFLFLRNGFFSPKRARLKNESFSLLFELSLMCILINLSTPLGWAHAFVWICLPIALLLHLGEERGWQSTELVLFTLALILLAMPFEMIEDKSQELRVVLLLKTGTIMFASLLMLGLVFKLGMGIKPVAKEKVNVSG